MVSHENNQKGSEGRKKAAEKWGNCAGSVQLFVQRRQDMRLKIHLIIIHLIPQTQRAGLPAPIIDSVVQCVNKDQGAACGTVCVCVCGTSGRCETSGGAAAGVGVGVSPWKCSGCRPPPPTSSRSGPPAATSLLLLLLLQCTRAQVCSSCQLSTKNASLARCVHGPVFQIVFPINPVRPTSLPSYKPCVISRD